MAAKIEKRGIYLYINGDQVANSLNGVRAHIRKLKGEMDKLTIGSAEWIRKNEEIQRLNSYLSEYNVQVRNAAAGTNRMQSASSGLKGMTAKFTALAASVAGVSFAAEKAIEDYSRLSEAEADVTKYTGMTTEQVEDLNEEFKKMDTRTSREALNALAADAGRLGLKSKADILDFVEAADKITVSLGEDLGEDAVKNIGKLADLLGDKSKSMKENMLSIGSAVNEVAQNSSAAEPYLVDFSARLAGTAKNAKISAADVIGYASVLDQSMLETEMSSTAFSTFIQNMFTKTGAYAQQAGMDVKSFTELLNKDANEALKKVLEGISRSGGLTETSEIFKELGVNGARSSAVINALAQNIGKVDKEQETANKAYTEGTSIINEFNTKNNTQQALAEKAKKQMQEQVYLLGSQLLPLQTKATEAIATSISFLVEHKEVILAAAAAYAAYAGGAKLATLWQNRYTIATKASGVATAAWRGAVLLGQAAILLLSGNMKKASQAMRLFSAVTKLNPIGLALSAAVALGAAMYAIYQNATKASAAQQAMANVQKDVATQYASQASQVEFLIGKLKSETVSLGEKKTALEKLKEILPEYNGYMTEEGKLIDDTNTSMDTYLRNLERRITLEANEKEITSAMEKRNLLRKELKENEAELAEYNKQYKLYEQSGSQANPYAFASSISNYDVEKKKKEIKELTELIENLGKESESLRPKVKTPKVEEEPKVENPTKKTTEPTNDEREKKISEEIEKEQTFLKMQYATGLIDKQKFEDEMEDLTLKGYQKKRDLYKKDSDEYRKHDANILDLIITSNERHLSEAEKTEEEARKIEEENQKAKEEKQKEYMEKLANIREEYSKKTFAELKAEELSQLDEINASKLISEEEYQRLKKEIVDKYAKMEIEADAEKREKALKKTREYLSMTTSLLSSLSDYVSASADAETAKVEKSYDARIKAAGDNAELVEQLEQEKEQKLAKIKKESAQKTFGLQVAQTIATTALACMQAFSEGMKSGGLPVAMIYTALTAAQGMIQLATIQKQKEAAMAGYYSGGYTGGSNPRERRGYAADGQPVHGGEFVANHVAVGNPDVRDVLDVIDQAQRAGTVQNLTTSDLSSALSGRGYYTGGYTAPANTTTASPTSSGLNSLVSLNKTLSELSRRLDEPFTTINTVNGNRGIKKTMDRYDKMINNAKR